MAKPNKGEWKKLGTFNPFWAPWDEDTKHAADIQGTATGVRLAPKKGKYAEQAVIAFETSEGEIFDVGCSGSIRGGLRDFLKLNKEGEAEDYVAALEKLVPLEMRFEYKGERKVPGQKTKMHDVIPYIREEK
jgi:hypothetical protein